MASRPFEEVPAGRRIFVDTNILIYHLLDDDLYGTSGRAFLQRIEARSVTAFTSPIVAAETLFVYLRAWIITHKKVAPKGVLRYLKRHRAVVQEVDFQKPRALLALFRVLPLNRAVPQTSFDFMMYSSLPPSRSSCPKGTQSMIHLYTSGATIWSNVCHHKQTSA